MGVTYGSWKIRGAYGRTDDAAKRYPAGGSARRNTVQNRYQFRTSDDIPEGGIDFDNVMNDLERI